jgi:ubiquinone/menaquinone biosynthesis C-methylase UbiE
MTSITSLKKALFESRYSNEKLEDKLSAREILADELIREGDVFVDIGCGIGALVRKASGRYATVVGLDLAPGRLRRARELDEPRRVIFVCSDIDYGLPFRDSVVSCVTCIATFEYAYNPFFLLDEIWRILCPNGRLILQFSNLAWLPRRVQLLLGRVPTTGAADVAQNHMWNGGYLHSFALHDFLRLLNECGFEAIAKRSSGRTSKVGAVWPSLLFSDFILDCRKKR